MPESPLRDARPPVPLCGQLVRVVGTVISLCSEEVCPVYLGNARRLHSPLPDPAGHVESEEASLEKFRGVRDELCRRLSTWLSEEGVTPTTEARL